MLDSSLRLRLGALWMLLSLACSRQTAPELRAAHGRIVPGCASAVDYLCWLGAFDRVVALPQQAQIYSNGLPAEATRRLPQFAAFRAEPILALEPDLVVCDWFQAKETRAFLASRGIPVVALVPVTELADILDNLERVGAALGDPARVSKAVARLRHAAGALRSENDPGPRILPYFNHGSGARTAGAGTVEDIMISLAGARNAASLLGYRGHVALGVERVLTAPPDFFLTGEGGQRQALLDAPYLGELTAVRAGRIVVLPQRLRNASSPYVIDAARALREELRRHPASGR